MSNDSKKLSCENQLTRRSRIARRKAIEDLLDFLREADDLSIEKRRALGKLLLQLTLELSA